MFATKPDNLSYTQETLIHIWDKKTIKFPRLFFELHTYAMHYAPTATIVFTHTYTINKQTNKQSSVQSTEPAKGEGRQSFPASTSVLSGQPPTLFPVVS